jgi:hypothetical protein
MVSRSIDYWYSSYSDHRNPTLSIRVQIWYGYVWILNSRILILISIWVSYLFGPTNGWIIYVSLLSLCTKISKTAMYALMVCMLLCHFHQWSMHITNEDEDHLDLTYLHQRLQDLWFATPSVFLPYLFRHPSWIFWLINVSDESHKMVM